METILSSKVIPLHSIVSPSETGETGETRETVETPNTTHNNRQRQPQGQPQSQ